MYITLPTTLGTSSGDGASTTVSQDSNQADNLTTQGNSFVYNECTHNTQIKILCYIDRKILLIWMHPYDMKNYVIMTMFMS